MDDWYSLIQLHIESNILPPNFIILVDRLVLQTLRTKRGRKIEPNYVSFGRSITKILGSKYHWDMIPRFSIYVEKNAIP
jgi:hypothetical protein